MYKLHTFTYCTKLFTPIHSRTITVVAIVPEHLTIKLITMFIIDSVGNIFISVITSYFTICCYDYCCCY